MNYHLITAAQTEKELSTGRKGLTAAEAARRAHEYGPNRLTEEKKPSLAARFLDKLRDPMIIVLIGAAVISGITSAVSGESGADVFIIMAVVIINAALGVYQENKAEKAIAALKKMTEAECKVIRDGQLFRIRNAELVPGDLVVLEAGDAVPADGRITESFSLKIEEAALTGESVPVEKTAECLKGAGEDIPLGDRRNLCYLGSTVVYGRGRAVITATGMATEMGKIAGALANTEEEETPLQKKLSGLSRILSLAVLGICLFIFAFSLIKAGNFTLPTVLDTFMVAVSLAVAAIPEGLAAVVTVVLSIGVTAMSKRSAVIRRLTAVETLGSVQVICSDKTGTLTQNKMTVTAADAGDVRELARALALCSDAQLRDGRAVGEPTECALVDYAYKLGLDKSRLEQSFPRVAEAPFDSLRKLMSTVHQGPEGLIQFTKGAPDELLKKCGYELRNGQAVPLTEASRKAILDRNKQLADQALRVLAGAYRKYESLPEDCRPESLESGLVFLGLAGMIDPVRPEVRPAIEECRQAGIRPVMITGDHRDTAAAIAKELGIIESGDQVLTGTELDKISDAELERNIRRYSVYARVRPEHKVRVVSAWRRSGLITAMTGDGVNDAPSLKAADIGIGMGITGTDVTKNVADLVLADDNFATIVAAAEEGRRIYDNIRKDIQFLLSSNMAEVLSVFTATMLGFTILRPIHLLWINLITDTFPALALGAEAPEPGLMRRKPRPQSDGIFAEGLGSDIIYQGALITILTLAAYFVGHYLESGVWEIAESADGMTMAFLTMSMAEMFHSFNLRSRRQSIFSLKRQNRLLWAAMLGSLVLTLAVIYLPSLADAFGFEYIDLREYLTALGLGALIIPGVEAVKALQRKARR